jgi:hypothetical protein
LLASHVCVRTLVSCGHAARHAVLVRGTFGMAKASVNASLRKVLEYEVLEIAMGAPSRLSAPIESNLTSFKQAMNVVRAAVQKTLTVPQAVQFIGDRGGNQLAKQIEKPWCTHNFCRTSGCHIVSMTWQISALVWSTQRLSVMLKTQRPLRVYCVQGGLREIWPRRVCNQRLHPSGHKGLELPSFHRPDARPQNQRCH